MWELIGINTLIYHSIYRDRLHLYKLYIGKFLNTIKFFEKK